MKMQSRKILEVTSRKSSNGDNTNKNGPEKFMNYCRLFDNCLLLFTVHNWVKKNIEHYSTLTKKTPHKTDDNVKTRESWADDDIQYTTEILPFRAFTM